MSISEEDILRQLNTDDYKIELNRLFNSKEYSELVRQLSVNNARFSELPPAIQLTGIYLNQKGLDLYLSEAWRLLYRVRPPSVEEYLTIQHGGPFVDKIYDGWEKVLLRDFQSSFSKPVPNELVFSGCIGSGKTSIARFMLVWILIKICALHNPQSTLNVTQETLLVLALFTVTLDKASLALIKPFISLLDQSPYFQAVGKQSEFQEFSGTSIIPYVARQKYIEFPNNVIINMGSTVEHAISYSMFGAILDEAEFSATGGGPERSFALYSNLKERIRSRFLGSQYTLLTLVSSSRYTQGIIADYIENTDPNDPFTKIYSFAIWDIKHFDAYKDGKPFYVMVGNKSNPHRILDDTDQKAYEEGRLAIPLKCSVIKVPEVYRKDFQRRIADALSNLAGIAVAHSSTYVFSDDPIECIELCPELCIETNLGNDDNIFDCIPEGVFTNTFGSVRFKIDATAMRYVHLDLAETGRAAITIIHPADFNDRIMYVADLIIELNTNTKIDMTAISKFLDKLSQVCTIAKFTTDQYQSTYIRQQAIVDHIAEEVGLLSTIKTTDPYETASRIVQNKQLFTGTCTKLKKQLAQVQIDDAGKIKQGTSDDGGHGDVADSLVGALYSCVMHFDKAINCKITDWYQIMDISDEEKSLIVMEGFNSL
jgi:hypothetical protein